LAELFCDGGGPARRPVHAAADCHVPEQFRTQDVLVAAGDGQIAVGWFLTTALQVDGGALYTGCRVIRLDDNRLSVAMRRQGQIRGKRRPRGQNAETVAAAPAGQSSARVTRRFTPGPTDRSVSIGGAGAQIEIIALAGASDVELDIVFLKHVVGRPALQRLAPSVDQIDCAGAGPLARHPRKGPGALRISIRG
jgi:hypothetical protein